MFGLSSTMKNIKRLSKYDSAKAYKNAMSEAVLVVQANSVKRTPVDTGNLRSSHVPVVTKVSPDGAKGEVRVDANYAVYVHEMTQNRHPVGEAKFLSNAVNATKSKVDDIYVRWLSKLVS